MPSEGYKILPRKVWSTDKYSLLPIRFEDRYLIMQWRNEQLYHLRQNKLLTEQEQDYYFNNTIAPQFEEVTPDQILFSYLRDSECIGYGGLVHINWIDKNAEISFVMNTKLESEAFESNWINFLSILEPIAFSEIKLHKIYTFAFDIRPKFFPMIVAAGYHKEAHLKEHRWHNDRYVDAMIHSKWNKIN